jgi:hypothetical protein
MYINDPANRWYKEGREYKDLFRFRAKTDDSATNEQAREKRTAAGVNGQGTKKTKERIRV